MMRGLQSFTAWGARETTQFLIVLCPVSRGKYLCHIKRLAQSLSSDEEEVSRATNYTYLFDEYYIGHLRYSSELRMSCVARTTSKHVQRWRPHLKGWRLRSHTDASAIRRLLCLTRLHIHALALPLNLIVCPTMGRQHPLDVEKPSFLLGYVAVTAAVVGTLAQHTHIILLLEHICPKSDVKGHLQAFLQSPLVRTDGFHNIPEITSVGPQSQLEYVDLAVALPGPQIGQEYIYSLNRLMHVSIQTETIVKYSCGDVFDRQFTGQLLL